jgi:hypothetical protein
MYVNVILQLGGRYNGEGQPSKLALVLGWGPWPVPGSG